MTRLAQSVVVLALAVLAGAGLLAGGALTIVGAAAAAPSVFMSSSGSGTACTQAAPCSSLQAAYNVARGQGGATVEMAGGSYSSVQLASLNTSSTGMVVFRPASGASVTMGEFRPVGNSNIEFDGIASMGAYLSGSNGYGGTPAGHLVFRDDHFVGADFFVRYAYDVQVYGGSIGDENGGSTPTIGTGGVYPFRAHDFLADGVAFRNVSRAATPTTHQECLFVQGIDHVTIRNSTFTNCSIMDVYLHGISGEANPTDIHLLNNHFGPMGPLAVDQGYYTVLFRADAGQRIDGFDVEGNTFDQPLLIETGTGATMTGMVRCNNTGTFRYTGLVPPWQDCPTPPPSTTTSTTTTVPTTSTPTVTVTSTIVSTVTSTVSDCTPDAPYATCADEIAALKDQLATADALAASLQSQLDAAKAQIDTLQHQLDAANNTITQVKALLQQALGLIP